MKYEDAKKLLAIAWDAAVVARESHVDPDEREAHNMTGAEAFAAASREDLIRLATDGSIDVPGSVFDGCAGNEVWATPDGQYIVGRRWQGTEVVYDVVDTVRHRVGRSNW